MYCSKCGNLLAENSKFCSKCGNQVGLPSAPPSTQNATPQLNGNQIPNEQPVSNIESKKPFFSSIDINKILIIAIILVVVATGIGVVYSLSSKRATRTIMIYMVGSDLESNMGLATRDLLDIDYASTSKNNVRVVLMAGGSKSWKNTYIDSNETSIYELQENGFVKVDSRTLQNMGTANNLSYFLNYVYNNYQSNKYDLLFWNHGGGVEGSEYDELNNLDNLSIVELKEAFESSPFKEKNKLDAISFRTCLNATIEVASALKDYGKYLVASEEVTYGSRYDSALKFINEVTGRDSAFEYGKKEIEGYKSSVTTYCNEETRMVKEENYCVNLTYSIIDLSKIEDINKNLESFSKDIQKDLEKEYNNIVKVRASLNQYASEAGESYDMIDLYDLVRGLKDYSPSAAKVLTSIEEAVLYNTTNNSYSHGLSVYFPYNASRFLGTYSNIAMTKSYGDLIYSFNDLKNSKSVTSFANFSNNSITTTTKEEGKSADFEMELTDEQVNNYAGSVCDIFVDLKNGYYKLVYLSRNTKLEGNKLKANVQGKMLRIADKDYPDESTWLRLIESDIGEDYTESNSVFILGLGTKKSDIVTATIRVDDDHPNGYIKSMVTSSDDSTSEKKLLSKEMVRLEDYITIQVAGQGYKIMDENGKFNPQFLKAGDGIYTGRWFTTDAFQLIPEDFNSNYDYYGVFIVKDVAGNSYYSDIVKMN